MGSHEHIPVEVDPAALQGAKAFWGNFANATKYSVIAIAAVLLLMGFFLL